MKAWKDLRNSVSLYWNGDKENPENEWYIGNGIKIESFNDGTFKIHNTMTASDHYDEVTDDQYMTFKNLGWDIGCCCVNIDVQENRIGKVEHQLSLATDNEEIERLELKIQKLNDKKDSHLKKLSTYLQTLIK
jgi:hypothetical protein